MTGSSKEIEMKKALLLGGAALLAFALTFSACENTYEVKATQTIPDLEGPGNFKAINEQEGVITLTWDPVYDAGNTYEVWRKTGEEPAVKLNATLNPLFSNGSCRYDDIVSPANPLKNAEEYTYTVVAVSRAVASQVVHTGTSSATITPAKIPAAGAYTVPAVEGLTAVKATASNGQVVRISWNKPSNPGVTYKKKFNDSSFTPIYSNSLSLSADGTKVVYDYPSGNLADGEQYKAEIVAAYAKDYYKESAPASAVYTHSDPSIISSFSLSSVTLYANGVPTGSHNVSVYWKQSQQAPADVAYELYRHKYDGSYPPSAAEWEAVTGITIPAPDATGFIQLTLNGDKVPAYRQWWIYKLVAKAAGEEVGSGTMTLVSGPWSNEPSFSLYVDGSVSGSDKKIEFTIEQVTSGLYTGDTVEFYAVPWSYTDTNGQTTVNDTYLSQFTKIGSLAKAKLESGTATDRKVTSGTLAATGSYSIKAYLRNGAVLTELGDFSADAAVTP
jgi:hypothetical protein